MLEVLVTGKAHSTIKTVAAVVVGARHCKAQMTDLVDEVNSLRVRIAFPAIERPAVERIAHHNGSASLITVYLTDALPGQIDAAKARLSTVGDAFLSDAIKPCSDRFTRPRVISLEEFLHARTRAATCILGGGVGERVAGVSGRLKGFIILLAFIGGDEDSLRDLKARRSALTLPKSRQGYNEINEADECDCKTHIE